MLQQLKSGLKRTVTWNKYQPKTEEYNNRKSYLDCLIYPSFQGMNKLFVLSFANDADRIVHTEYYLPKAEIKGYTMLRLMEETFLINQ